MLLVKKGRNLTGNEMKIIDKVFHKAFKNIDRVNKHDLSEFYSDTFFIVKSASGKVLSAARLRPAKIICDENAYKVQGIADVVSVVGEHGYGKIVMNGMLSYLEKRKLLGVGFCKRSNSGFYKRCGFSVRKNRVKKFFYMSDGKIVKSGDDDVVYNDTAITRKILASKKIEITRPFW